MNKKRAFEIWAPAEGRWSPWAKPVLFACMEEGVSVAPLSPPLDLSWVPAAQDGVALVLDLPGPEGVGVALALAAAGYRPVPLYNAVPASELNLGLWADLKLASRTIVDVLSIMKAMQAATPLLEQIGLPPNAPPVFMLDANRRGEVAAPLPGDFDNRSVSFTTDFPSANFLIAHGIRNAILVQRIGDQPSPDLAHTLRHWQEAGLALRLKRFDQLGPAHELEVPKPPRFRWVWQRVLETMGLRRSPAGGFGSYVPVPGSAG